MLGQYSVHTGAAVYYRALLVLTVLLFPKLVCGQAQPLNTFQQQVLKREPELVQAVLVQDAVKAERLLAQGADANIKSSLGEPVLLLACGINGKVEIVKSLLDHGAKVNTMNAASQTPLTAAVAWDKKEIVTLLIARKANVNQADIGGYTPLITAVRHHDMGIVKLLLEKGARVNSQSREGMTALETASGRGFADAVKLLLAHGADVNQKGTRGRTPLAVTLAIDKAGQDRSEVIALLTAARNKEQAQKGGKP